MITLLAFPNPGPPEEPVWLARADAAKRSATPKPMIAEPPTRMKSRRVTPSQVSLPAKPGITSIVVLSESTNGRKVGYKEAGGWGKYNVKRFMGNVQRLNLFIRKWIMVALSPGDNVLFTYLFGVGFRSYHLRNQPFIALNNCGCCV